MGKFELKNHLMVVGLIACFSGCGSSGGACVGESSTGNGLCYQDWSESECQTNDDEQINGSGWEFFAGDSCADAGFPVECEGGVFRSNSC